jgi:hypothetical protein
MTGNGTKAVDPGASLSLAALATNKTAPLAAIGNASGKASTNILDEVFGLMGSSTGVAPASSGNQGDMDDFSEFWDLDSLLMGSIPDDKSEDSASL